MNEVQILTVTIAGITLPAEKVICPDCNVLHLESHFVYSANKLAWSAVCPKGHRWGFRLQQEDLHEAQNLQQRQSNQTANRVQQAPEEHGATGPNHKAHNAFD